MSGRTDNEIKNYWRTRFQKQAKLLKCDVSSKQFHETMLSVWMPRLVEQMGPTSSSVGCNEPTDTTNMNIRLTFETRGSIADDPLISIPALSSTCENDDEGGNLQDTPTNNIGQPFQRRNDPSEVGDFLDCIWNDIEFVGFLQEHLFD